VHYVGNRIIAENDTLSFGVMLGRHPWGPFRDVNQNPHTLTVLLGDATGNSIDGAFINLVIEGTEDGNVMGNVYRNHHPGRGGLGCESFQSADYTAAHFATTMIQDQQIAVPLVWDYPGSGETRCRVLPQ